jgi:O-antigen/teichoic acid export membrane protein
LRKTFVTNLALLVLLNLLIKPFWIFGIDRVAQNTVGAENYGVYISLYSLSIILNIILDLGITNFNNRNIARHNQLLSKYFSNIVVMKFILGVVYFLICIFIGLFLGFDKDKFHIYYFLIFNQFLISFILYLRSNISGLHLFKTDSIISVVDRILLISICSILLFSTYFQTKFNIQLFVYAQTFSYLITFIIAFYIVLKKAGGFVFKFDYKFLFLVFKQSYPFALLVLLMSLYTRVDIVMIEKMLDNGAEQAGIYAQSYRILDAVSMFAFLFSTLLLPMFSKMIKVKEDVSQLVKLASILLIIPAFIFVIATWTYSWEFMKLLYHEHYDDTTIIFKVLIIGFLPIASNYIFGTLLTANNSLKHLNIMAVSGMLLNIALNYFLIPKYNAYGAAIASLATQIVTAIIQIVLAGILFKFKINYILIIKMCLFFTFEILMFSYFKYYFENWITNAIALIGLSLIVAIFTKMLSIKDIYKIVKGEES